MLTFPDFRIAKNLPSKAFSRTSKIRRKFLLAWKYHFRHCNGGYHGRLFNKQTFRFLLVSNKKMKTFQFLCPQFLAPFPKELEKDILTWLKRRWNSSSKKYCSPCCQAFSAFLPKKQRRHLRNSVQPVFTRIHTKCVEFSSQDYLGRIRYKHLHLCLNIHFKY